MDKAIVVHTVISFMEYFETKDIIFVPSVDHDEFGYITHKKTGKSTKMITSDHLIVVEGDEDFILHEVQRRGFEMNPDIMERFDYLNYGSFGIYTHENVVKISELGEFDLHWNKNYLVIFEFEGARKPNEVIGEVNQLLAKTK